MAVTETWLTGNDRDDRTLADIANTLNGYDIIHKPRMNSAGGGVAVFFRKGIPVTQIDSLFTSMECLDLKIFLGSKLLRFPRPPPSKKDGLTSNMFFEDFSQLLENLTGTSDRCLITGDFNFHIGTTDNDAVRFLDLINSAGLNQHVTKPTHNHGHVLDLVITSFNDDLVSNLQVLPSMPSDHAAITFLVDFPCPALSKVLSERRKLQNINLDRFVKDLAETSLLCSRSSNLDTAVMQYDSDLSDLINIHAPVKQRTSVIRPFSPWFSDHLHELKREKRRWERKWQTSDLEINLQIYQQKASEYYAAIENAKRSYYFDKISTSTQAELFNLVDGLFTVKNKTILPKHTNRNELAARFRSSFDSKVSDLLNDLSSSNIGDCHRYDRHLTTTSELRSFQTVTYEDVKSVILSSRTKSCSLDPIPTSLLKKSLHLLVCPITAIINSSLTAGVFPSKFKHGLVTPVIKKKDLDPESLLLLTYPFCRKQ